MICAAPTSWYNRDEDLGSWFARDNPDLCRRSDSRNKRTVSNGEEKNAGRLANRSRTGQLRRTCVEGEEKSCSVPAAGEMWTNSKSGNDEEHASRELRGEWLALF